MNQTGDICPVGSYCPAGAADHIRCDPGKFCDATGLPAPRGNCSAGWYCELGSSSQKPRKCQTGHYCPEGTPTEKECPPGTFNPDEGKSDLSHCLNCTAGYYCPLHGQSNATRPCNPGYYCPSGSTEGANEAYKCPPGYYCPTMSPDKIPCKPGKSCCFYRHK